MSDDKTKMQKVQRLLDKINEPVAVHAIMLSRQSRLRELSRVHGVALTALAASLTVSTLSQYLRVKNPPIIGEAAVVQAENILNQL